MNRRGSASACSGTWRSDITLSVKGERAARLELADELTSGRGTLSIASGPLTFRRGGLQPDDLTPLLIEAERVVAAVAVEVAEDEVVAVGGIRHEMRFPPGECVPEPDRRETLEEGKARVEEAGQR